jgi:ParB family chromosome partitioning protein
VNRPAKDRLGRGLGALLGEYLEESESREAEVRRVSLETIAPNPLQPRREFDEQELTELADSISENGLLQPLVVRPASASRDRFELVAGERRFRAIQRLGWSDVPVLVRTVDDETLLVLALVENLQREALNPLEEAEGYRTLADRFGLTQAEIAHAVGKDRSTVANMLRLLKLPPSVRKLLGDGVISMGHARALAAMDDDLRASEIARRAAEEGWSVREVERRASRSHPDTPVATPKSPVRGGSRDPVVRTLEEALREALATRVVIRGINRGKGVIEVPFHGTEDFERLFALMARREASDVLG